MIAVEKFLHGLTGFAVGSLMDGITTMIRITIGDQVFTGVLEQERAPLTCAAFLKLLPLRGRLIQARWSGEAAWVPLGDLDVGVGVENAVHRPEPGQLLLYPTAESETEILFPYGLTAFAAKCGPLSGNHFLTLHDPGDRLREIGRRVLWEGAQEIRFDATPPLATYRTQAERLLRWHREGNYSIGEHVRRLDRYRELTDREVLALELTLSDAQEIVAAEAGHETWAASEAVAHGLKNVIPIFFVRDVERSAAWYRDMLGFDIDFVHGKPPFYGSVSRDRVCLHLRFVHEPYFTQVAAHETSLILASIYVADVHALFQEFQARGVEFSQTLKKQPSGGTDFHVKDPDGNIFSFVS